MRLPKGSGRYVFGWNRRTFFSNGHIAIAYKRGERRTNRAVRLSRAQVEGVFSGKRRFARDRLDGLHCYVAEDPCCSLDGWFFAEAHIRRIERRFPGGRWRVAPLARPPRFVADMRAAHYVVGRAIVALLMPVQVWE